MRIQILILNGVFATVISLAQNKATEAKSSQSFTHNSVFVGGWVPTGHDNILGTHLATGFRIGIAKEKMRYDFILEFKVGRTPTDYKVKYNDTTIISTHQFFGGYSGVNISRDLINNSHYTFYGLVGIGIDVFEAVEKDLPKYPRSKSIGSVIFSVGVGNRNYPFKNNKLYVAVEASYNFVNYQNDGGTPLGGNSLNLRLIFGGLFKYKHVKRIPHRLY